MGVASTYHENATMERAAAARETPPWRRYQRERSAERWEAMARSANDLAQQIAVKMASRIEQPNP